MSYDGQCIYHGSPQTMLETLRKYDLICLEFHNPSDFILEVASNELGIEKVMLLSTSVKASMALKLNEHKFELKHNHECRTLSNIWTLTMR
jgi:hypothetical protein